MSLPRHSLFKLSVDEGSLWTTVIKRVSGTCGGCILLILGLVCGKQSLGHFDHVCEGRLGAALFRLSVSTDVSAALRLGLGPKLRLHEELLAWAQV